MLVIGITGGIGSGKSLVTSILKDKFGAGIIDTDTVAKELMKPGGRGYINVVNAFGDEILSENGTIDNKKLSDIVFNDSRKLALLDSLTHPLVSDNVDLMILMNRQEEFAYTAVETALLIEAGYAKKCDRIWYVYADRETRLKRLAESRGMDRDKAEAVISKQASEDAFRNIADDVIDNSGTPESTELQIKGILDRYTKDRCKLKTGRKMVDFE